MSSGVHLESGTSVCIWVKDPSSWLLRSNLIQIEADDKWLRDFVAPRASSRPSYKKYSNSFKSCSFCYNTLIFLMVERSHSASKWSAMSQNLNTWFLVDQATQEWLCISLEYCQPWISTSSVFWQFSKKANYDSTKCLSYPQLPSMAIWSTSCLQFINALQWHWK